MRVKFFKRKIWHDFSYNQNFVPWGLSALAPGLYTCIKLCNLYMSSSLKLLEQFSPDFTWGLLPKGLKVPSHRTRWPPCPYTVKIFFSRTKKALGLNLGILHRGLKVWTKCGKNDCKLTFDLFMATADSRRAVVSFWRKNVAQYLLTT